MCDSRKTKTALIEELQTLREGENKYRTLVENLPQKIFLKDRNSVYVSCNDNLARDLKIKSEEIAGKTDCDLVPKELAEKYRADDKRIIESGETEAIEEKYIQEGEERIIHTVKTPVKDAQGNVVGILGIFWDITESKRAEEALRESQQQKRAILDSIPDIAWLKDKEGRYIAANEPLCQAFGIKLEDLVGKTDFDISPEDLAKRYRADDQEVMKSGKRRRVEEPWGKKGGERTWIETIKNPIYDDKGQVVGTSGIARDITERKRAEEALRGSEEKYRLLFEGRGTDNTVISVDGVYLMMNEKGAEHLGGKPEHFVGKSVYDTFPKDAADEYVKRFRHIAESGETKTYEDLVELPTGNRWFLTNARPVKDPDGNITSIQLISQDVTEHKKAEEELLFKSTLLEAQSETSIDGVLVVDSEGKSILFNKKFGRMWNIPQQILDTRDDEKMLQYVLSQLKDPEQFLGRVKYLYAHKNEKSRDEIQFKDGRVFDRYSSPLLDSDAKYCGRVWYFRDITERKKMDEELRESEERFRTIFDNAPDGLLVADAESKKIYTANKAFCQMLGYNREELKNLGIVDIHPKEDLPYVMEQFEKQARRKFTLSRDLPVKRKDGSVFYADINSFPITLAGKSYLMGVFRDITERKNTEQSLRESENKYRTLLENLPQKIFLKDRNSVYVSCNDNLARDFKIKSEEIAGKTDYDLFSKKLAEKYRADDKRIIETERTEDIEESYIQEGREVIVHTVKTPVKDAQGNVIGILGIFWDITERKRAEEAYRAIVDHSLQGFEILQDERVVFANQAMAKITGYTVEEMLAMSSQHVQALVHPEDQALVWGRHRDRLKGKELPERYEFRGICKDGTMCWLEIHARRIEYQGKPAVQVAYLDITERKSIEDALRQSEQRFRSLVETSSDWVWEVDQNGIYTYASPKVKGLLGYEPEEIIGKTPFDLMPPGEAEQVTELFNDIVESRKPFNGLENTNLHKDGRLVVLETSGVPILDEDDNLLGYRGIDRDITERKRAEDELQKARDELEIRVEQRTADLARANKELRNEITERKKAEKKLLIYQKQLRSLASELSLAEERLRRRFAMDVHDHVGQNLAISKIKIESLRESVSSPELAKGLEEIRDLISQTIESTRSLTFELSPPVLYELGFEAAVEWLVRQTRQQYSLSADFKADGRTKPLDNNVRILLFQAVRELLVNVAKHAQAHNVTVSTRRVGNEIRVSVEDDGVGFDMSQTGSYDYKTGGFGLFSIRERLGHIGGRLEIESKPGVGTRVTLTAPIDQESQNSREGRK